MACKGLVEVRSSLSLQASFCRLIQFDLCSSLAHCAQYWIERRDSKPRSFRHVRRCSLAGKRPLADLDSLCRFVTMALWVFSVLQKIEVWY